MRKKIGVACVVLGAACLLSALGFVAYNRWEAENAAVVSQTLLSQAYDAICENQTYKGETQEKPEIQDTQTEPTEMETVALDGYDCIGVLAVPILELELPVLADWSYAKLKKAPCHYYGTNFGSDFVIAAHNYGSHFGKLSQLQEGDLVFFTAADGAVYTYQVALLETLPKEATMEMIASGFDLSLYTCTPGGANRVTVRCVKK